MYSISLTDSPGKRTPFGNEISKVSVAVNQKPAFCSRRNFMSERI